MVFLVLKFKNHSFKDHLSVGVKLTADAFSLAFVLRE
jgi:hypothetical protein